jgi:hypothetical protein
MYRTGISATLDHREHRTRSCSRWYILCTSRIKGRLCKTRRNSSSHEVCSPSFSLFHDGEFRSITIQRSTYEQNAQHAKPPFGQQPNQPPPPSLPGQHVPEELQHAIEDTNAEIGVYLGIIYFVVEVFRHDESFGDELSKSGLCS